MWYWLKRVMGFLMSLAGSILLAIGTAEDPEILLPLGVVFLVWGVVLFLASRRDLVRFPLQVPLKQERALLRLAQQRGGRLATPEVALELGLSLAQAKAILDSMVLNGYASYTSEEGQVIYRLMLSPLQERQSMLGQLRRMAEQVSTPQREREQELVQLALRQKGRLTAAEVTAQLGLSLDDAKNWLDSLAERGHLGYEVTDDGRIVYRLTEPVEPDQPVEVMLRRREE